MLRLMMLLTVCLPLTAFAAEEAPTPATATPEPAPVTADTPRSPEELAESDLMLPAADQTASVSPDGGVAITIPLTAVKKIVLEGYKLCSPEGTDMLSYYQSNENHPNWGGSNFGFSATPCHAFSECVVTFGYNPSDIPTRMEIYRVVEGQGCQKEVIADVSKKIAVVEYEASMVLTPEVRAAYEGHRYEGKSITKTANSKFYSSTFLNTEGNTLLELRYKGGEAVTEDEALVFGTKFTFHYPSVRP